MLIIKDVFMNVCVCITFIFIGSQLYENTSINTLNPMKIQILSGIASGILGIALIIFPMEITSTFLIDLRYLPIVISIIYLGYYSTILTGTILTLFPLAYFGINLSSLYDSIHILLLTLGCLFIGNLNVSTKIKWINMFLYISVVFYLLNDLIPVYPKINLFIFLHFLSFSLITNIIIYYISQHLCSSYFSNQKLREESINDFITGLKNVRGFNFSFNNILDRAKLKNEVISLLMIDIDFFKKINDTYGHASGDLVLSHLGDLLSELCRGSDIVARIGGEEFCVVLKNCSQNQAFEIAERIRKNVESQVIYLSNGNKISITLSIGVSVYPDTIQDIYMLKDQADKKLYEAKRTGRNKICI